MKKQWLWGAVVACLLVFALGYFVLHGKQQGGSASAYGFNPNYVDAIEQKKPELCASIEYALQSGPADEILKVTGDQAVDVCKSQAEQGRFGCECDAQAVLDSMRLPN